MSSAGPGGALRGRGLLAQAGDTGHHRTGRRRHASSRGVQPSEASGGTALRLARVKHVKSNAIVFAREGHRRNRAGTR